jgi:protease IV
VARRSVLIALAVAVPSLMVLTGLVLSVLFAVRGRSDLGFGGRIAILEVQGVIANDAELLEQIRAFRDDPSVKGYVVQINSPGGVVGSSQSLYEELRRVREEDDVPVIASIGDVGASGGYYVALAADSIYALPGSITGSIGVIMEFPDASQLMGKVGVKMDVVKSAEHKDIGSPFRPITPGDREILTALINDVFGQFREVVARERKLAPEAVLRLADGRILSGRQAQQQGLVDRMGNLNDAVGTAGRMAGLGDAPRTTRPPKPETTLLDVLLGRGTTGVLSRWVRPLENANTPRLKFAIPW